MNKSSRVGKITTPAEPLDNHTKQEKEQLMSFEDSLKPGEQIVIKMGVYEHQAIVSDRRCPLGKPMLISATTRTGTVQEEPYDTVVNGRRAGYAPQQSTLSVDQVLALSVDQVLARARSKIGKWDYNILSQNCEHFANWARGLRMSSPQVKGAILGAASFAVATELISETPSLGKRMLSLAIGGLIGLTYTQVLKGPASGATPH